ncbi:hypothetical protein BD311DRAFT_772431 [Dichomitus squalens]|uniref:Uncharacterized protein n=1 Tax=Dichomitus squalens TaxID=114155 RepID=A0A4Q9M4K3_9APHY|nr:hypothetical protein BD311DRAFT_772431 [Dichomitus squalens]
MCLAAGCHAHFHCSLYLLTRLLPTTLSVSKRHRSLLISMSSKFTMTATTSSLTSPQLLLLQGGYLASVRDGQSDPEGLSFPMSLAIQSSCSAWLDELLACLELQLQPWPWP